MTHIFILSIKKKMSASDDLIERIRAIASKPLSKTQEDIIRSIEADLKEQREQEERRKLLPPGGVYSGPAYVKMLRHDILPSRSEREFNQFRDEILHSRLTREEVRPSESGRAWNQLREAAMDKDLVPAWKLDFDGDDIQAPRFNTSTQEEEISDEELEEFDGESKIEEVD